MKKISLTIKFLFIASVILLSCNKDAVEDIYLNPDAGPSFLDIENDGYVVELGATPADENQRGIWRIYNGVNGRFEDETHPKSKFYGEPGEVYQIGWEVSEGKEYKADVITVSFRKMQPVLKMQLADTLHNNISLYLKAEAPKFGATGEWYVVNGVESARIEDATNHKAAFIGTENEDYTVRWALKYGSKEEFEEFSFTTDELRAFAGYDNLDIKTEKYADKYYDLNAFLPAGATGEWEVIGGDEATVYDLDNPKSLFEGNPDVDYKLLWKVNLDAREAIDTLDLRFRGIWGVFVDKRDKQQYKFTEANGLEWMAENFNYAINSGYGSWYYGNAERSIMKDGHALETPEERKRYGRLYDQETAKLAAPEGWRLPTNQEFEDLINSLGGPIYAGPEIEEGGSTGIELGYAGYLDIYDTTDPAIRNAFQEQDKIGLYWCSNFAPSTERATMRITGVDSAGIGTTFLYYKGYGASVRYVREVQKN